LVDFLRRDFVAVQPYLFDIATTTTIAFSICSSDPQSPNNCNFSSVSFKSSSLSSEGASTSTVIFQLQHFSTAALHHMNSNGISFNTKAHLSIQSAAQLKSPYTWQPATTTTFISSSINYNNEGFFYSER
jgi:hypothetical protein